MRTKTKTTGEVDHPAPFDLTMHAQVRQRIIDKKAARYNGHLEKIAGVILPVMRHEPGRIFSNTELEVVVENAGFNYTSLGMTTTYMTQKGLVERVGAGRYRCGPPARLIGGDTKPRRLGEDNRRD